MVDLQCLRDMQPIWDNAEVREALAAYIQFCVEVEEGGIASTIDSNGYRITLDAAAQRKIEYHATRKDCLMEFLPLLMQEVNNRLTSLPT